MAARKAKPATPAPDLTGFKNLSGLTLTITSSINGFRRAGRAWSSEPTTVSAAEFTPEQLAQLRTEPRLTISETA